MCNTLQIRAKLALYLTHLNSIDARILVLSADANDWLVPSIHLCCTHSLQDPSPHCIVGCLMQIVYKCSLNSLSESRRELMHTHSEGEEAIRLILTLSCFKPPAMPSSLVVSAASATEIFRDVIAYLKGY